MWDDFIIGSGETEGSSSWLNAISPELKEKLSEYISSNDKLYRIMNCILDVEMTIFKDTDEGKKLEQLIKDDANEISNYLTSLVFKYLPIEELLDKISRNETQAFSRGYETCKEDFKKFIGI